MKFTLSPILLTVLICTSIGSSPSLSQNAQNKSKGSSTSGATRLVPVKKAFPFYDIYLGLPPEGRDGFRLGYRFGVAPGSARPQINYVLGDTRIPLQVGASGQVLNMPNAAMYSNGALEVAGGQPRSSVTLDLEAIVPLSRTISVAAATNPLTDYSGAIRRAGPLAAFAPRLTAIRFVGVTGGEAVFGDGRRVPLGAAPGGGVMFKPSAPAMRGATTLSFATAPTEAEFAK
jgi:hypothetical protein